MVPKKTSHKTPTVSEPFRGPEADGCHDGRAVCSAVGAQSPESSGCGRGLGPPAVVGWLKEKNKHHGFHWLFASDVF